MMGTRAQTTAADARRMTKDDFERVLATFGDGPTGLRNRALVLVMADCALRVAEALALGTGDLVRKGGYLTHIIIRHGKGDKEGQVAVTVRTALALDAWQEARAKLGIGTDAPLFCTVSKGTRRAPRAQDGGELVPGEAMYPAYVRAFVKKAGQAAGLDVDLHPHLLRHWAVTRFLRANTDLEMTRQFARHADVTTTARVYAHLVQEDVDRGVGRMEAADAVDAPGDVDAALAAALGTLTTAQKKALAAALLAGGE